MSCHDSIPCMRAELDLFSYLPTQLSVEKGYWKDHHPISSLQSSAPIEFVDSGSGEDFVDLTNTLLYINGSVKNGDGSQVVGTTAVAPVNNLLHSLFNQVDVLFNGVRVASSSMNYAYKSYIETHLNYSKDAKESRLSAQLYTCDNNLSVEEPVLGSPGEDGNGEVDINEGLNYRHEICVKNNAFELIGKPHVDVFNVKKYLLPGVEIRIRLSRGKNAFSLMCKNKNSDYKIVINEAKLFLRKVKVSPEASLAIEKRLKLSNAIYPLVRTECKVFHIPSGTMTYTQDNLFTGQQPKRMTIALVDNVAYNGTYNKNQFSFDHFNLNKLIVYIDGERVPWAELKLAYDNNQYLQAYYTLFAGGDGISSDVGNAIERRNFIDGNVMYCFDVTPELSATAGTHVNPQERGNLRVDLGFGTPLQQVVNVIVLCEFDNNIQIGSERGVQHDYAF